MNKSESPLLSPDSEYEVYRTDRRSWQEASEQASLTLNRSLITLATSGIGFTVVLLTQGFVPENTIEYSLLVGAWLCFLVCIHLLHKSHIFTQRVAKAVIDEMDALFSGSEAENASNERTLFDNKRLNYVRLAQWLFYFGVICVLFYVTIEVAKR